MILLRKLMSQKLLSSSNPTVSNSLDFLSLLVETSESSCLKRTICHHASPEAPMHSPEPLVSVSKSTAGLSALEKVPQANPITAIESNLICVVLYLSSQTKRGFNLEIYTSTYSRYLRTIFSPVP